MTTCPPPSCRSNCSNGSQGSSVLSQRIVSHVRVPRNKPLPSPCDFLGPARDLIWCVQKEESPWRVWLGRLRYVDPRGMARSMTVSRRNPWAWMLLSTENNRASPPGVQLHGCQRMRARGGQRATGRTAHLRAPVQPEHTKPCGWRLEAMLSFGAGYDTTD